MQGGMRELSEAKLGEGAQGLFYHMKSERIMSSSESSLPQLHLHNLQVLQAHYSVHLSCSDFCDISLFEFGFLSVHNKSSQSVYAITCFKPFQPKNEDAPVMESSSGIVPDETSSIPL